MKFPSHVNLPADAREELIDMLNTQLANAIDLHWQIKQAHWNIRGKHFISRHELFDTLADHARLQADKFAERAGTLGGYAQGTIRIASGASELPEYDLKAINGEEHMIALTERFARYGASIREGIQQSEDCKDPVTVDLLTQILGEVELDLWFLESHLHGERRPAGSARGAEGAGASADA